jgi:hypothetical protein
MIVLLIVILAFIYVFYEIYLILTGQTRQHLKEENKRLKERLKKGH